MSIKELVEFNPHVKKAFGLVDCRGSTDFGVHESEANNILMFIVVGLRKFWMLPISHFLIHSLHGETFAGITCNDVLLTFDAGIKI